MIEVSIYRVKRGGRPIACLPQPERVDTVSTLDGHDLDDIFGPVVAEGEHDQQRVQRDIGFDWLTVIKDSGRHHD
jgi:hypothetical protein